MPILILILSLLFSGCVRNITVGIPDDAFSKYLHDNENMRYGCASLAHDATAKTPDCHLIYSQFDEFRTRYAQKIDPNALYIKMGDVSWYGATSTDEGNGIPRMAFGDAYAQAYFSTTIPTLPTIVWANPYAVGCEALHFFHWKLHGTDLRTLPLDGDEAHPYVFEIIGHGMQDDPMKFECWREAEERTPVPSSAF